MFSHLTRSFLPLFLLFFQSVPYPPRSFRVYIQYIFLILSNIIFGVSSLSFSEFLSHFSFPSVSLLLSLKCSCHFFSNSLSFFLWFLSPSLPCFALRLPIPYRQFVFPLTLDTLYSPMTNYNSSFLSFAVHSSFLSLKVYYGKLFRNYLQNQKLNVLKVDGH